MSLIKNTLGKAIDQDDLEQIAGKEDLGELNAYLKKRPVLVLHRPKRYIDATGLNQEELMDLVKKDAEELSQEIFEPWVLELDGKKRLPVFSSQKAVTAFASRTTTQLNKVFSVRCIETLLENVTSKVEVDIVDLNLFSQKSWEIEVRKRT